MEPVTDLWCKLGRDMGLKPSGRQGGTQKWRFPMFQSINPDKIRKLLRSEIFPMYSRGVAWVEDLTFNPSEL